MFPAIAAESPCLFTYSRGDGPVYHNVGSISSYISAEHKLHNMTIPLFIFKLIPIAISLRESETDSRKSTENEWTRGIVGRTARPKAKIKITNTKQNA